MPITCDCVPTLREFSYGNSTPEIPVGDLRTKIENREYYHDQTISDMILPRCLSIGSEGFRESSITVIDAPMCQTIGNYAFYGCNGLSTDMDLSSVETVGDHAFAGLSNNRGGGVIDLGSVKTIKSYAFENFHFNYGDTSTPTYIIMSNIEEIQEGAFKNAGYNIRYINDELNLPKCRIIGSQGFRQVGYSDRGHYLKKIFLPSIQSIGNYAFQGLDNVLEEVHLGSSCTSFGSGVFYGSSSSNWGLFIEAINPPTLPSGGLGEGSGVAHIYVPAGSVNAYKSASNWSSYSSIIEAIPT